MSSLFLSSLESFLSQQFHRHEALIIFIVIGMIAGLLAQMILPGRGFGMLTAIAVGVVGAWLGDKFIAEYLEAVGDPAIRRVVAALIGAMLLTFVINAIRGGEDRDKTHWRHN